MRLTVYIGITIPAAQRYWRVKSYKNRCPEGELSRLTVVESEKSACPQPCSQRSTWSEGAVVVA